MTTRFKTLREFLHPKGTSAEVTVPDYQRGYKWAVKRDAKTPSSAEHLLNGLLDAWNNNPDQQYFLQGITVVEEQQGIIGVEKHSRIELIDGQQRITTLFLILRSLGRAFVTGSDDFKLGYEIRKEADEFLRKLKDEEEFDWESEGEDDPQDIHWFREALWQIRDILDGKERIDKALESDDSRAEFAEFLYDKVTFLCVVVDRTQAADTFTMMNGQKATMHTEELVKAHLLHQVSVPATAPDAKRPATFTDLLETIRDFAALDWETEALRSRYAREWDKWVYWWNRKEVQAFFDTDGGPLGLLLRYYFHREGAKSVGGKKQMTWGHEYFKALAQRPRNAKLLFKALRDLQKQFEDVFNEPKTHNYLKLSLICATDWDDKCNILGFFLAAKPEPEMREYAQWRLVKVSHEGAISENVAARKEQAQSVCKMLGADIVYRNPNDECNKLAAKQLLRLNVEEYNKLEGGKGVAFDFAVWNNQSLEHILPKSRVWHDERTEDGKVLHRRGDGTILGDEELGGLLRREEVFAEGGSEHCIGNLVLLWKPDNSAFKDMCFEEKKRMFFDLDADETKSSRKFRFASRNLLHSIAVFAEPTWTAESIMKNRDRFLVRFRRDYGIDGEEKQ